MTLTAQRLLASTCLALAGTLVSGCAGWSSWEDSKNGWGSAPQPERAPGPDEYVVVRGDTVYSIAFRNSLDFRELAAWNGIGSSYLILPGQVLRLKPPPRQRHQTGDIESEGMTDIQIARPQPITGDSPAPVNIPPPVAVAPVVRAPAVAAPPAATQLPQSGYNWIWPTDGVVVRGYGQQGSKGLDFTGKEGQPVRAAAAGRVVYSGNALKGYGELIIIKHDDTYLSAYGYNRSRHVKEGDTVTAGQPIGKMGRGPENKPVLHFEIRERGKPINPASKLPAGGPGGAGK